MILTQKNLYNTRKVNEYLNVRNGRFVNNLRQRPKKNLVGLFSNYGFVTGCISAFYDMNKDKTNISYARSKKEIAQCAKTFSKEGRILLMRA